MKLPQRLTDRLHRKALHWILGRENRDGPDDYLTLHRRPKRADRIGTWPEPGIAPARAAVVMQGPPATAQDFTLETLKLYRRQMPGTQLILSTWADTEPAILGRARDLGVTVVLSDKPAIPGLFNVNMQIVSAAAGVRRAVEDGAEWILKTRTDQRLYAPDALAFLVALAQAFPIVAETPQRHRIIGVGAGSLKFAPYHPTDQTLFGSAPDMLAYWTPPLRETAEVEGSASELFGSLPIGRLCRQAAAESYLASQFLTRIGRPLDWTLEDSWAAYRDHFCFADLATTDFFWEKGQIYSQREHSFVYEAMSNRADMGFRDWLLLYGGHYIPADARRYEPVLLDRFNEPVPAPADPPTAAS